MNPEVYGGTLADIPIVTVRNRIYRASWMQPEPTRDGATVDSPLKVWNGTEWAPLVGPPAP
jgi:hypothetical protein